VNGLRERFAGTPIALRVVVGLIVVLVLFNLAARARDAWGGGGSPSGAPSSSYATAPAGLAAYSDLLGRWGHRVTRQRGDLTDGAVDARETLMVLDPTFLSENEAGVALTFVVNGGRLVIGGTNPERYLRFLRDRPPSWAPSDTDTFESTRPPFTDVSTVETAGDGMWDALGSSRALVGDDGAALVTVEQVGRGEIYFVADVSPLSNDLLGRADNAALGLLLAGDEGRPVVFAEGVHGYGATRGIAAIPSHWKVTLVGLALAAIVLMWARGRRLGPPEDRARDLPPARREYVDALAITLERTRDPAGATAAVRVALRSRIAARAGLGPDAGDADYERVARQLGLTDVAVNALVHGAANDTEVMELGRALAALDRRSA
jgi:hypothetical protein